MVRCGLSTADFLIDWHQATRLLVPEPSPNSDYQHAGRNSLPSCGCFRLSLSLAAAGLLAITGCRRDDDRAARVWPEEGFVRVADDVTLSYRDWGGEGPPIVLFTGLGNTAAIFDDLAPRLTNEHRVIGLTRRGFGNSTVTETGYDVATRVADDLAALQALGVGRALLVGHSIAGDELTGIVRARPELVAGLVYLDAAFDRTDKGADAAFDKVEKLLPPPTEVVRLSGADAQVVDGELKFRNLAAAQRLMELAPGAPGPAPASELRAQLVITPDGLEFIDASNPTSAIKAESDQVKADYRGIAVPVTALYADWGDPAAAFPITALAGADLRDGLRASAAEFAAWAHRAGIDQVRALIPHADVDLVSGAPHYIFLKEPEMVSRRILETARQASW